MKNDGELDSEKQLRESSKTTLPAKEDRNLGKQEMTRVTGKGEKDMNFCQFSPFICLWVLCISPDHFFFPIALMFSFWHLPWEKNIDGLHTVPVKALPSPAFPPRLFSLKSPSGPSLHSTGLRELIDHQSSFIPLALLYCTLNV